MQTNHVSIVKRDFLLNNSIVMWVVEIKDFIIIIIIIIIGNTVQTSTR